MTTAARPTFDPAKGGTGLHDKGLGKITQSKSSRDQPANLKLKERAVGQDTAEELEGRDFEAELEARERAALELKGSKLPRDSNENTPKAIQFRDEVSHTPPSRRKSNLDATSQSGDSELNTSHHLDQPVPESTSRERFLDQQAGDFDDEDEESQLPSNQDKESQSDHDYDDDDDFDGDDDESEDEDPAALLAELEKIKKERALEKEKKEQEQILKKEKLISNSSTSKGPSSFILKRPWDDDVPFKHCSRGHDDKKKPDYVNDTLRSDSHKKFMDKYIR